MALRGRVWPCERGKKLCSVCPSKVACHHFTSQQARSVPGTTDLDACAEVRAHSGQHHSAHQRIGSEEEPTDLLASGRIRLDADLAGVESMAGMRFEKNGRGSTKETRKKRGQAGTGRNQILELHP